MENTMTVGEELKQEFLESIGEEKVTEVRTKVQDILNQAVKDIRENIKNKKEPVAVVSSMVSKLGIESKNIELEKLFQSFEFSVISRQLADEMGLVVHVEAQGRFPANANLQSLQNPIMEFVCIITFK